MPGRGCPRMADLPTICEKGRHQNCIHTRMAEKRAAQARPKGK